MIKQFKTTCAFAKKNCMKIKVYFAAIETNGKLTVREMQQFY